MCVCLDVLFCCLKPTLSAYPVSKKRDTVLVASDSLLLYCDSTIYFYGVICDCQIYIPYKFQRKFPYSIQFPY